MIKASQELLQQSINSFKDTENIAELIPFKRTYTKSGYNYILSYHQKSLKLSCVIHINVDYQLNEFIGFYRGVEASISTRQKLKGSNYYIKYQDMIIFVNGYNDYTETMGQYLYKGIALRSDRVKLIDFSLDNKIYGYSSLDILLDMPNYLLMPNHENLSTEIFNEGVILVDVLNQENANMLWTDYTNNTLNQNLIDEVRYILINMDRNKACKFLHDLHEYSINSLKFGVVTTGYLKEVEEYDDVSNLRSIIYEIVIKISYNMEIVNDETYKEIRHILFKID